MHRIEKKKIFLNIYKIFQVSAETWKNSGVEVVNDIDVNSISFRLNKKHIETEIGH